MVINENALKDLLKRVSCVAARITTCYPAWGTEVSPLIKEVEDLLDVQYDKAAMQFVEKVTVDFNERQVRIIGSVAYGQIGLARWRNDRKKVYTVYSLDGTPLAIVGPDSLELVEDPKYD